MKFKKEDEQLAHTLLGHVLDEAFVSLYVALNESVAYAPNDERFERLAEMLTEAIRVIQPVASELVSTIDGLSLGGDLGFNANPADWTGDGNDNGTLH